MFDVFFRQADVLYAAGQPFALAVVVRHEPPISGKPGDKALVLPDGTMHGWIGGGCTQPVVIREAQASLKDGRPRLVRVTPTSSVVLPAGIREYEMTCHSGGTLDIYIEPVMPRPQLVILGASVVAQTLASLGKVLHYHIAAVAPAVTEALFPDADIRHTAFDLSPVRVTPQTFVVVSTQGEGDVPALVAALATPASYVAFVASRKKAAGVFEDLRRRGVSEAEIARIKAPAGFDIKARLPEEIAVSILAEIIHVQRTQTEPVAASVPDGQADVLHIEGMSCMHCVHTVQTTLEQIEGVAVAAVVVGEARIHYDPSVVDRSRIVEAVAARGYRVLPKAG